MAKDPKINCSALVSWIGRGLGTDDFAIVNATDGQIAVAAQCSEVCLAIWGSGNPDISGIGVSQ